MDNVTSEGAQTQIRSFSMDLEQPKVAGIICVLAGIYCLFFFGLSTRGALFSDAYKDKLKNFGVTKTMVFYTFIGAILVVFGTYIIFATA